MKTTRTKNPAAKPAAIMTAVAGGIVLLAAGTTAAIATAGTLTAGGDPSPVQSADATGITAIDVDSGATWLTVEFGDVQEATLTSGGPDRQGRWTLEREDDELVLQRHGRPFGNWCIFGFCGEEGRATVLTLPEQLNDGSLDAGIDSGAGTVTVDGDFRDLDVQVGAGEAFVNGAARMLSVSVGAGTADVDVESVTEAAFEVSAGEVIAQLSGSAPNRVGVDVAVGTADLTLPEGAYDVTARSAVGDVVNDLDVASDSSHVVEADVSAGEIFLRPGA